MKKVMKYVFRVVLVLILLALIYLLIMDYQDRRMLDFSKSVTDHTNKIQAMCGVVQCDMRAEQLYGQALLSDDAKEEMKATTQEIMKKRFFDQYDTAIVVQLMVLDEYFDLGYAKKLRKELDKRLLSSGLYASERDSEQTPYEILDDNIWIVHYTMESQGLRRICDGILEASAEYVNDELNNYPQGIYTVADLESFLRMYAACDRWELIDGERSTAFLLDFYTDEVLDSELETILDATNFPVLFEKHVEEFSGVEGLVRDKYVAVDDWSVLAEDIDGSNPYSGVYLITILRYMTTFDGDEAWVEAMRQCMNGAAKSSMSSDSFVWE